MSAHELVEVPLDDERWRWADVDRAFDDHAGRRCVVLSAPGGAIVPLAGVELLDGVVEADVCVPPERSFHGLAWRARCRETYESFFLRPHQVGNPDAVQYTPVSNGVSSWQLYHGDGCWNPVTFPIGEWLTLRVAFAGDTAVVTRTGAKEPLLVSRLRHDPLPGEVGLLVGGDELRVAAFRLSTARPSLPPAPPEEPVIGALRDWWVSDPFPEAEVPARLEDDALTRRSWTAVTSPPTGLVDVARLHPLVPPDTTVLARTTITAERVARVPLELGYSDRVTVFLNGEPLYRGEAAYRSRDYRFLGSIGWFDTVYLPLAAGANHLVLAVAEEFGGWGFQARLPAASG